MSVIVATNQRREFIEEALESVLAQDAPRAAFEVIVAKGFVDPVFDSVIHSLCDQIVTVPGDLQGQKWKVAIRASSGRILIFMDDDDLFLPNKISRVIDIFQRTKAEFYHNEYVERSTETLRHAPAGPVEARGTDAVSVAPPIIGSSEFDQWLRRCRPGINSSSIATSRGLAFAALTWAEGVSVGWDTYLLYVALSENARMVSDGSVLTIRRVHPAGFTNMSHSFHIYVQKQRANLKFAHQDYSTFLCMSDRLPSRRYVSADYSQFIVFENIFNDHPGRCQVLATTVPTILSQTQWTLAHRLRCVVSGLLGVVSGRLGRVALFVAERIASAPQHRATKSSVTRSASTRAG